MGEHISRELGLQERAWGEASISEHALRECLSAVLSVVMLAWRPCAWDNSDEQSWLESGDRRFVRTIRGQQNSSSSCFRVTQLCKGATFPCQINTDTLTHMHCPRILDFQTTTKTNGLEHRPDLF